MQTRQKIAILVGITDYKNNITPLPFCKNDVEMMQDVLSKKGFCCKVLIDGNIRDALEELSNAVAIACASDDTIIFYFSGHGADVIGEQVLLGQTGSLSSLGSLHNGDLLLLSEVLNRASQSLALKLFVIDACRTSTIVQPQDLAKFSTSLQSLKRSAFQQISNCVVAYASADGQKSRGSDNVGSLFTLELVKQLKEYECDFIHAVQNSVTKLRQVNAKQIPWLYASTYSSKVPDRIRIEAKPLESVWPNRRAPDKFVGYSAGGTYGIRGINLLAFEGGVWVHRGKILRCGNLTAVAFARESLTMVAVRKKSSYYAVLPKIPTLAVSSVANTQDEILLRKIQTSAFSESFGISVAPAGDRVCMFGSGGDQMPGIECWSISPTGAKKRLQLSGIPSGQCNATAWVSSDEFYASFSKENGESSGIYSVKRNANGIYTGQIIKYLDTRVTALAADGPDVLWLGDAAGAIIKMDFSSRIEISIKRRHKFDPTTRHFIKKTWKSKGNDILYQSPAVFNISHLREKNVLAASYFDQTLAFFDTAQNTFINAFLAEQYPRQQPISDSAGNSFLSTRGYHGTKYDIADN